MTEQTNAELIAEARDFVQLGSGINPVEADRLIEELSRELEAAEQERDSAMASYRDYLSIRRERDAALAVIEKVQEHSQAVTSASANVHKLWAIQEALATAPADALREHDAALIEKLADEWEALVQKEKPPVRGSMWLYAQARQRREEQEHG